MKRKAKKGSGGFSKYGAEALLKPVRRTTREIRRREERKLLKAKRREQAA